MKPLVIPFVAFVTVVLGFHFWTRPRTLAETYELVIGDRSVALPRYDDPKAIRDDIIGRIKPLWDELPAGESESFFLRWTENEPIDERIANELATKGVRISGHIRTVTNTPRKRFVKNRNGSSGIEQLEENGSHWIVKGSTDMNWELLEALLDERMLGINWHSLGRKTKGTQSVPE